MYLTAPRGSVSHWPAWLGASAMVAALSCAETRRSLGEDCLKGDDCVSGYCSQLVCAEVPPTYSGPPPYADAASVPDTLSDSGHDVSSPLDGNDAPRDPMDGGSDGTDGTADAADGGMDATTQSGDAGDRSDASDGGTE